MEEFNNKDAANIIKSAAKRRYVQPLYNEVMNEVREEANAASKIKSAVLNKLTRDKYNKANQQVKNYQKLKNTQNAIAFNKFSTAAKKKKKEGREYVNKVKNEAAKYIQNAYRGHLAKNELINKQIEQSERNQEEARIKRIRDYENALKQKRIELTYEENEQKGINYERKLNQNRIKAEEEAIEKRVKANKARIEREREKKEAAARELQRFARYKLGENEATTEKIKNIFKNYTPSVSGDTTLSQLTTPAFSTPAFSRSPSVVGGVGKVRKERSDKGVKRGPYKEKRPVGRPRKVREESGLGLRERHHPKKKMVHTTKEQQLKN